MSEKQAGMFEDVNHDDIIANLGGSPVGIKDKWPHLVAEMIDLLKAVRESQGATELQAKKEALEITERICKTFGGMQMYVPKGHQLEMAVRNNRIWNDFTGSNVEQLMHKYDLTQVRIYKILKEQRQLHIKTKQNDLFN